MKLIILLITLLILLLAFLIVLYWVLLAKQDYMQADTEAQRIHFQHFRNHIIHRLNQAELTTQFVVNNLDPEQRAVYFEMVSKLSDTAGAEVVDYD